MVVLAKPAALEQIALMRTPEPWRASRASRRGPVQPGAAADVVRACERFGFFSVVEPRRAGGRGGPAEAEAVRFFASTQAEKDASGPADPFGYGSKRIGRNGDMGGSSTCSRHRPRHPLKASLAPSSALRKRSTRTCPPCAGWRGRCWRWWRRGWACRRGALADMVTGRGQRPGVPGEPLPALPAAAGAAAQLQRDRVRRAHGPAAGVHPAPNGTGLQVALHDGRWVSVPPNRDAFFVNVGDSSRYTLHSFIHSLVDGRTTTDVRQQGEENSYSIINESVGSVQVLTNGRLRSVRHRVVAGNGPKSRVSMIYFAGPPLAQRIAPPQQLLAGTQSLPPTGTSHGENTRAAYRSPRRQPPGPFDATCRHATRRPPPVLASQQLNYIAQLDIPW
ncbi:hypothetical protein ZWY2020_028115 [Hordeum vulgare]|nr:hypothetical protein ZWY2020_028115 [Hordeum vulgare]